MQYGLLLMAPGFKGLGPMNRLSALSRGANSGSCESEVGPAPFYSKIWAQTQRKIVQEPRTGLLLGLFDFQEEKGRRSKGTSIIPTALDLGASLS